MKILDETVRRVVKRWSIQTFFFLSLLSGILLTSGSQGRSETKPTLVILPFLVERAEDRGEGVVCSICKGIRRSGEILSGSHHTMTHLLHEKMEAKGTFRILPRQEGEVILSEVERETFQRKPVPTFLWVGKRLAADFLWIGTLFRFEKRVGSSLGVERPASVSFDLHLFRLRDERVVWIGKFDETQRPLSENLLKLGSFMRRGGSWLTAAELASVGMDELLKGLPGIGELEERR